MNDTYVYVLAFNIYFHYTVENVKLKASNALQALGGKWPSQMSSVGWKWPGIWLSASFLCSLHSVNTGNACVLAVNLAKGGRWREEHMFAVWWEGCFSCLLEELRSTPMARQGSRVGYLGKTHSSGKQTRTKNQSLDDRLGCASFIPEAHFGSAFFVTLRLHVPSLFILLPLEW